MESCNVVSLKSIVGRGKAISDYIERRCTTLPVKAENPFVMYVCYVLKPGKGEVPAIKAVSLIQNQVYHMVGGEDSAEYQRRILDRITSAFKGKMTCKESNSALCSVLLDMGFQRFQSSNVYFKKPKKNYNLTWRK